MKQLTKSSRSYSIFNIKLLQKTVAFIAGKKNLAIQKVFICLFIEIKLKNDFKGETESKFNLGQLNAYKLMFAMKVSIENE